MDSMYSPSPLPLAYLAHLNSRMLGSLTFYRRLLHENVFSDPAFIAITRVSRHKLDTAKDAAATKLPTIGHAIAGVMAGSTVSFIAAPVEHVKARLQVQYAPDKSKRLYQGPIDCTKKIVSSLSQLCHLTAKVTPILTGTALQLRAHGIAGLYHGLFATLIFRSFFFFWWGSYDIFTRLLHTSTNLSTPAINFWAGGLSAQVFWLTSYPSDVVKQRIMTDPLGGSLNDGERRFAGWKDAAREIWRKDGARGFWRGFLPCFLRAFPANAMALLAFEGVMRGLPE